MNSPLRPVAGAFVALGTFIGTLAVVTADLERILGVNDSRFGLILAVALAGTAVVGGITGTMVERWGVPRVLATATAVFSGLVGVLAIVADRAPFPVLALLLLGIYATSGALDVAMNTAATAMLADEPGQLVRFHAWFNGGAALGAGLTALTVHLTHQWRFALLIPVVTMTLTSLACRGAHIPVGESGEHHGFLHALRSVRAEGLLLLAAVFACGAMVEGGIDTWGVLVLRDQLGIGIGIGAIAQMFGQGVAALARATLGPAAGSLGTVRGIAIGAGLATGGLILLSIASAPLAVAGLVIGAAGISVCWPMLLAHASQGMPSPAGVVSGVTAIGYLGFVVGPAVVGSLAGIDGIRPALLLLAVVAFVVAVAPRFLRPPAASG